MDISGVFSYASQFLVFKNFMIGSGIETIFNLSDLTSHSTSDFNLHSIMQMDVNYPLE